MVVDAVEGVCPQVSVFTHGVGVEMVTAVISTLTSVMVT